MTRLVICVSLTIYLQPWEDTLSAAQLVDHVPVCQVLFSNTIGVLCIYTYHPYSCRWLCLSSYVFHRVGVTEHADSHIDFGVVVEDKPSEL